MAKAPKAAPATKNDAVKTDIETNGDAVETETAGTDATTATTIPASSETGGDGDPAVSPEAPSEPAIENPDGGSNDAEKAPAATVEGIAPVDAPKAVAPELATADFPMAHEPGEDAAQTGSEAVEPQIVAKQPLIEVKLQEEPFTLSLPTVYGGKLKGIGETVWLTRENHAAFVLAGRVDAPWPDATT